MLYPFRSKEFNQNLPLQLWMFGVDHLQPPVNRPKGVAYFQWFFCLKGQGEVTIEQQSFLISPGQGFLIFPDESHKYQGISDDWTLHILAFNGTFCLEILGALHMERSGAYHFSTPDIFTEHIRYIHSLYEDHTISHALSYSKACYSFLLDLSQCITRVHELSYSQEDSLVLTVITWLEENYANPISLQDLSCIVNLSKDYLCARFKTLTGQTIMSCLQDIRLGHARQFLIQYPEKKVLEIAGMCGFESPSYFGKIFKDKIGVTPENYRRKF